MRDPLTVLAVVPAALLAASLAALMGCGPAASNAEGLTVRITSVAPDPPSVPRATLEFDVREPDGLPVAGASLSLEGNMTHAGMKPTFAAAAEVAPGRYRAELPLTMGSDWFVVVSGTRADGSEFERTLELTGVRGRE